MGKPMRLRVFVATLATVAVALGTGCDGSGGGGGTGGAGGGGAAPGLDLSGDFAVRAVFTTHVKPRPGKLGQPKEQDATTTLLLRAVFRQSGSSLAADLHPCQLLLPQLDGSPSQIKLHREDLSGYVPPVAIAGKLSSKQPGAVFAADSPTTVLVGARLGTPATDAMPAAGRACASPSENGCYYDQDGDSAVGVTLDLVPPVDAVLFKVQALYVGMRMTAPLGGTAADASRLDGPIAAADVKFDQALLGCRKSGGGSCSQQEIGVLADNQPDATPTGGDFRARRLPKAGSCADVVAQAASLFGN